MKFFYVLTGVWLLILLMGDPASEAHGHVLDATFILLMFLALAVFAVNQRINRAVKQIQESDYDIAAHDRREWWEVAQLFLAVIVVLLLGTAVQGFGRCLSDEDTVSISCIWRGIQQQVVEDLD